MDVAHDVSQRCSPEMFPMMLAVVPLEHRWITYHPSSPLFILKVTLLVFPLKRVVWRRNALAEIDQ